MTFTDYKEEIKRIAPLDCILASKVLQAAVKALKAGKEPDLAATLESVAADPRFVYEGPLAEAIADAVVVVAGVVARSAASGFAATGASMPSAPSPGATPGMDHAHTASRAARSATALNIW